MLITIKNAIIHPIEFIDDKLSCTLSGKPQPPSEALTQTVEQLHKIYSSKASKAYGHFATEPLEDGEVNLAFMEALSAHRILSDFENFSQTAGKLLSNELSKYQFTQAGFLMLVEYQHTACDYLFVALINAKPSLTVTQSLQLSENEHLDLTNLQLAARIDLTELSVNPESRKFISFIKGRAGRKVSDFFLDFMGCVEGVNAKEQSKTLVEAVEAKIATSELSSEQGNQVREQLYDFCKEKADSDEVVEVSDLNDTLAEAGLDGFDTFITGGDFQIETAFPVETSQLKSLKKFSGSGAGVTVSFDSSHLGERVVWDPNSDTLTIHGLPANLKDQLQRRK